MSGMTGWKPLGFRLRNGFAGLAIPFCLIVWTLAGRGAVGAEPPPDEPIAGAAALSSVTIGGGGAASSNANVRGFFVAGEPAVGEAFGTTVDLSLGMLAAAGSDSVTSPAGLELRVVEFDTLVVAGELLHWTLRVVNRSDAPATFDWVRVEAPPGRQRRDLWGSESEPRPQNVPPATAVERQITKRIPANAPGFTDLIVRTVMLFEGSLIDYDDFATDIVPSPDAPGALGQTAAFPAKEDELSGIETIGESR